VHGETVEWDERPGLGEQDAREAWDRAVREHPKYAARYMRRLRNGWEVEMVKTCGLRRLVWVPST